ncbi:MAG: type II toxin-antitoxin system PemK/MazF family toxin [Chloroflexi bacterium]|nr:type II toxin-antitoxin system PemK/MazF family toxin [Chloroflexota bacterium]
MGESRWSVYTAELDPFEGSEQGGRRPVIIVSNDDFNRVMPVVTVLPITSLKPGRRVHPSEVPLKKGDANLGVDSLVLAYQIRTISKKRIQNLIGAMDDSDKQQEIEAAIKLHLGLH